MVYRVDNRRALLTRASSETLLSPAECGILLWEAARRKSPQRGLEFDITGNDVVRMVAEGICPRTGRPFDLRRGQWLRDRPSLDRVDNSVGYVDGNVEVVTKQYNVAKSVYTSDEMLEMAIDICRTAGLTVTDPHEKC